MAKVKNFKELKHPLAEVFGHKPFDDSAQAKKHREDELCPYNNNVPRCTKDKKDHPLGVCAMNHNSEAVVICPVRFRENWMITSDASEFFFGTEKNCIALKEVRLREGDGSSAGNIDVVIAKHDDAGKILDFGAVEIQSVYVSGNIRNPFEAYMENPTGNATMDWSGETHYPRPDFLSSSRKRLAPQVIYKGQILKEWGKRMAVVVDKPFFETLPDIDTVEPDEADVCWLVYDLYDPGESKRFQLKLFKKVYTTWGDIAKSIVSPDVGDVQVFIDLLEKKITKARKVFHPDNQISVHSWAEL